jgi:propionyl-CoA carboxylase alpha chain
VEHPVTEWITLDLVELQIKVARRALEMKQEDLKIKGHAMELRCMPKIMNDFYQGHLDVYQLPGRWNSCRQRF